MWDIVSWLNSNGSAVTAWATVVLALVTIFYAYKTNSILNETKKSREIAYLISKLEKFYLPLQNTLSSVYQDENNAGEGYIIEKADVLNKKLKDVENYNYLASSELKKLVRNFPYTVHCFNHESVLYNTGDIYYEMEGLLKEIEERIK